MSNNLAKVKELRELTGAGIQDCKTALSENNFDIEKSIEHLLYVRSSFSKHI